MIHVYDLVNVVKKQHYREQDFFEGDIEERLYAHDHYELKIVPLHEIEPVPYAIHEELITAYEQLETPIPPIVLSFYDDGSYMLLDGGHRMTVARKKGLETIEAYVGVGTPIWETDEDEVE